jgi:hypothetical protein
MLPPVSSKDCGAPLFKYNSEKATRPCAFSKADFQ